MRAILFIAGLLVFIPVHGLQAQEQEASSEVSARLPDGLVKTVFERLPAPLRDELARGVMDELEEEASETIDEPTRVPDDDYEEALGVRLLLVAAAYDDKVRGQLALPADQASSADLLTAAFSGVTLETRSGRAVRDASTLEEKLQAVLLNSPFVWRPRTPCEETDIRDPFRLPACVKRELYKSVVGIAWDGPSGLEVTCSGQLLSARLLITADHCFDSRPGYPVIVTHFTGGSQTAIRKVDGIEIRGLTRHPVSGVHRGETVAAANGLRGFDIAVVELFSPVPFAGFPGRADRLPDPVRMTVAGWGASDVSPVNGVGLEVSVVNPMIAGRPRPVAPSLLAWSALMVSGGGICRADSGGPVYSGSPGDKGAAGLILIGVVAGGNDNCKSGDQVITDITQPKTLAYLCSLKSEIPFCSSHRAATAGDPNLSLALARQ